MYTNGCGGFSAVKKKQNFWLTTLVMIAVLLPAERTLAENKIVLTNQAQIRSQILNGFCCTPNMSSGYKPRKLVNGKFKATENDSEITVSLDQITFGDLDGKPVAVALMYDNEGGSGTFESLMLYEIVNGKAKLVGSSPVGDRAVIKSLSFEKDGIRLVSEVGIGQESGKRSNALIKRSKFEEVECIDYELSKETKDDIAKLTPLYQRAFSQNPLTPEEIKQACEICKRHQKEGDQFAREFRLSMNADGWGVGPHPLTYQEGKPIFHEEDGSKKSNRALDLSK
jgi:hypothetical protein